MNSKIKTILKKGYFSLFILFISTCLVSCNTNKAVEQEEENLDLSIQIPAGANSWVVNNSSENANMMRDGEIKNWIDIKTVVQTYFKSDTSGKLNLGLNLNVPEGTSRIKVTIADQTKTIKISSSENQIVPVGVFDIKSGYNVIEIAGVEKSGSVIANISEVLIGGPATEGKLNFIKEDFYFGRRGPSVHLTYELPQEKDVEWFYSEINVPKGEDVIGSYYMANGLKTVISEFRSILILNAEFYFLFGVLLIHKIQMKFLTTTKSFYWIKVKMSKQANLEMKVPADKVIKCFLGRPIPLINSY